MAADTRSKERTGATLKEPLEIVSGQPTDNRTPDPWGVRRAELLLTSLKGVRSTRVVVSPDGEITEIHVLTETDLTPKQVVRNVESALLAQLGIKVDHRRISVAQTDVDILSLSPEPHAVEVAPIAGPASAAEPNPPSPAQASPPSPAVAPAPTAAAERTSVPTGKAGKKGRSVLYQNVEVATIRPNKVRVTVTLEWEGEQVSAAEDAADTPNMRLQAAARATVAALDQAVPDGTVDLIGAQFVEAFDTTFVFVGVSVLTGRDTALHTGTCEVRRGAEQAAALAVLDATNRWLRSSAR